MNRILLLAGAAFAAVAIGAFAHAEERRERREIRIEHHMGDMRERIGRIDANTDGFITRAEAQAEAERMFDDLDGDDNGKLDAADHMGGRHLMIHRMDVEDRGRGRSRGHDHEHGDDEDVDVTVRSSEDGGQTVIEHREVRIQRGAPGDGAGPEPIPGAAPMPPRPPRPPMAMMLFMQSDEADRNGDNALSKQEFVAQQLRYFDAADANGDGKIRFERPPMPPEAPQPPAPPRR